jgi:hypothetical protein
MDYLSLKTTIENMKNFQGKTYIQKISLLNKTCNSFTGKILNDKCKKIKQIFQTEFQKRHPRWIEPFDGINVDSDSYSEITDAISLAYNYDVVQKSPLCIYKFSKYESVEFRDIYCAGTAIDDYGRTSCRLFHINDFTQRLKISNNIDLGIGEKNCSKKALTQYKYYGFTGTVGICWFYNNSDKAKISGCYLLKDDFNINDEYKKSLKIK